ncbi:MAG TPA: hypothetical protein DD490_17820 [Acidobacteria bacterium]|nr:hypothetical protein [Acidobacteriota bacterium]
MTAAGPGAPGLIYLKAGPRVAPVWVSAQEAAASEPGDLRWPLFVEADQSKLRRFMAESERLRAEQRNRGAGESDLDCPIVLSAGDEDRIDPKPNRSFSDLTEQALAIYSGRVEEISPGFFSGLPSSLLLVSVKEELRASDLVARDGLLIPYSFARFKAGGATFCGGGAGMYQPKRGDQVLVFIYDPPLDAAGTLVYPRSPEIFFQSSDGRLIIPEPLKADRDVAAAGSLESLEDLLRWKLSNEPQRPSNPRADHAQ